MARTHGHGNPNWTKDETILALDLYFDFGGKIPSGSDMKVTALSNMLRRFPYHAEASRKDSFRNPDGVAFKLQNLRQVATGKGLGNVSMMDRELWLELGGSPERTKALAILIREGIELFESIDPPGDDAEFVEGRVITELHHRRERDPKLRERLLSMRLDKSILYCEMCYATPISTNPAIKNAQFEAHHVVPLASSDRRTTRVSDLVLLCANCHRLIHRAIAIERRWLTVAEAKSVCQFIVYP